MGEKSIFVSMTRFGAPDVLEQITEMLDPEFSVHHQGMFRYADSLLPAHPLYNDNALLAAHYHWCEQLEWTRRAVVVIVLLTGQERDAFGEPSLTDSMNLEVFDLVWRGVPVVWLPVTGEGAKIANHWHHLMRTVHPTVVSHLVDGTSFRGEGRYSLDHLCHELARKPIPHLPLHIESPDRKVSVSYQVCRPVPGGWEEVDLRKTTLRPVLRVDYGNHIVTSPYFRPQCEAFTVDFPLEVATVWGGEIAGQFVLPRRGFGQMRTLWVDARGVPVVDKSLGGQMMHWDFVCGVDHISF